jgi:hypothetical protein
MSIISTLGRQRWEDEEFKASWAVWWDTTSKNQVQGQLG